ncbi:MAG TPA: hypothetical protein VHL11_04480 [Phototrophicaceae bacterium]|nr:hypothetical protein [Phototrophicaceae bacterium]
MAVNNQSNDQSLNDYYEKWDEYAPRGLALIGFGVSIVGQAIVSRSRSKPFWRWFITGTIGLIVLNSGVAIFGEAVKNRALYDMMLQLRMKSDQAE